MVELAEVIAAGALWIATFVVLTLGVRRVGTRTTRSALLAAYPPFFALQVVLPKLLALTGALSTTGIRVAYGLLLLAGVLLLAGRGSGSSAPPSAPAGDGGEDVPLVRGIALICAGAVLAGLALFTIVSPVHIWDSLAYHMPMVASYIQNGGLEAWPTQDLRQVYRVNAGELQMLNVALLGRSDAWVELPNLLGLVVLLVATFELARMALRRPALPYLAVLLVLTAPQIVVGAGTSKNDLVFTAAMLCGVYWMIRAGRQSGHRTAAFVLLAALSTAIAGATKVMGLNVVGAVGLLALVLALRGRLPLRHVVLFGGGALAALLVLVGDVYLFNLGRTAIHMGTAPDEIHFRVGFSNLVEAFRFYVLDLTLKRLVRRPVFEHDFMHYGYLFPLMLGLGLLAAFRQLRHPRFVPASLTVMGGALFLSVIAVRHPIGWDQRFMIWLVPTLAVLALSLVRAQPRRRLLAVTWVAAVLAAGNLGLVLALESDGLFRRSIAHLASTGVVASYLDVPNRRYAFMNEGFDAVDRAAAPADSILYVGTDDSWMYPLWGPRFTRHVEGVWNAEHAAERIGSGGFRFLVIEHAADPALRAAAERGAVAFGYGVLVSVPDRTIFVRGDGEARSGIDDCTASRNPARALDARPRLEPLRHQRASCDGAST